MRDCRHCWSRAERQVHRFRSSHQLNTGAAGVARSSGRFDQVRDDSPQRPRRRTVSPSAAHESVTSADDLYGGRRSPASLVTRAVEAGAERQCRSPGAIWHAPHARHAREIAKWEGAQQAVTALVCSASNLSVRRWPSLTTPPSSRRPRPPAIRAAARGSLFQRGLIDPQPALFACCERLPGSALPRPRHTTQDRAGAAG